MKSNDIYIECVYVCAIDRFIFVLHCSYFIFALFVFIIIAVRFQFAIGFYDYHCKCLNLRTRRSHTVYVSESFYLPFSFSLSLIFISSYIVFHHWPTHAMFRICTAMDTRCFLTGFNSSFHQIYKSNLFLIRTGCCCFHFSHQFHYQ